MQHETLDNRLRGTKIQKKKNKGKVLKANTHQAGGCREPTLISRNPSLASKSTLSSEPGRVWCPQTAAHEQFCRETHSSGGQGGVEDPHGLNQMRDGGERKGHRSGS